VDWEDETVLDKVAKSEEEASLERDAAAGAPMS